MEASVFAGGILLRPKEVVDRNAVAHRVAAVLARVELSPEDAGHSEDDVMDNIIADIAAAREERRREA